jgi:type VI secretion system protein ImpE
MMVAQQLLSEGKPGAALLVLQQAVRNEPSNAKHRIFLFQLLAVLGQWDRAMTQLNMAAQLDAEALPMAQTYREAIRCELLRADIFSGRRTPLVFGEPPAWIALLTEALQLDSAARPDRAAAARDRALEQAEAIPGSIDGVPFAWLADADARLGPVFEAVINGRYFWVPQERVARLRLDVPADLRDAVWMPARFTFVNGGETVALVPTRYSETVHCTDEDLLLARRTVWGGLDALAGRGLGQRMFVTDGAEYALMDVREIAFEGAHDNG